MTLEQRYIEHLRGLTGDMFELAVCTRLGQAVLGFQRTPRKPSGDGGVDGFSHAGARAYCCYGPEPPKTTKQYEKAIVKKFAGDLRRLFEIEVKSRGKLITRPNLALHGILPKGRRIEAVTLISNWLESNRVLGPLHTKAFEYGASSCCTFIVPEPAVRIVGPSELAYEYPIDESAFAAMTMWTFVEDVQKRAAHTTEDLPSDFDEKMVRLESIRPEQKDLIRNLATDLRENWRTALAFDYQLLDTLPAMHRRLERARRHIKSKISQELLAESRQPWQRLSEFADVAKASLGEALGERYGPGLLLANVAEGETARLIGECTINWQIPSLGG